jgi:RHS repeat-associated protein
MVLVLSWTWTLSAADAEQLGGFPPLHLPSMAELASWVESPHWGLLPKQASGSAVGKSHSASAASTRANRGVGRAPGKGKGQLPNYTTYEPPLKPGKAGAHAAGGVFNAKTSKLVGSKSSATVSYWQNADGSITKNISQDPVNYQAKPGDWAPIDSSLARGADGRYAERANSLSVSFAGNSGSGSGSASGSGSTTTADPAKGSATDAAANTGELSQVQISPSESVGWSLQGAKTVTPAVSGNTATYAGILPDTKVVEEAGPTGDKESIVLSSAAAGDSWTFPLDVSGLTPSIDSTGAVDFKNSSGTVVGRIPLAYAFDSKVNDETGLPATTWGVSYALTTVNRGPALTVTVDPAWLDDPARVFPVTVDPTLIMGYTGPLTTYVNTDGSVDYSSATYMETGECTATACGNQDLANGLINLQTSTLNNAGYTVSSASLNLFDIWTAVSIGSSECTTANQSEFSWSAINVYPITEGWTTTGAKAYPGPTVGASIGSASPATWAACTNTGGSLSTGNWVSVPVSASWATSVSYGSPDYGLQVTGATGALTWRLYDSDMESSYTPYLSITYTDQAPQVTALYPPNGYSAPTLTPELMASAVKAPNSQSSTAFTYQFTVYNAAGTAVATSPAQSTGDWTVPSGDLSWSTTYYWTVEVGDGISSSIPQPEQSLTIAVPQPTITSLLSQDTSSQGFDAASGNYTTSVTDADISVVGPSLSVDRDYNAEDPRVAGAFGAAWSSIFDAKATEVDNASGAVTSVTVTYPDGSEVGFGLNANGTYAPPAGRFATFTKVTGGYTLTDKNDTLYTFTQALGSGVYGITSVADANGRAVNLNWSGGEITTMTSVASSRSLHLTWSTPTGATAPHIATVYTDPVTPGNSSTDETWQYNYSGDQLTSVCQPNSTTATPACTKYTYTTGSAYQSAALDAGPHSFWPLNETSGSTANDAILANEGADNATYTNVTLPTTTTTGTFKSGNVAAATFNGTSSYVSLPNSLVTGAQYLSISMWFETTSTGGILFDEENQPFGSSTLPSNATPSLFVGTDGKLHGIWYTGSTTQIVSSSTVTDGKWHLAVLSGAGNTQTLYLDGVAQGSVSGTINNLAQSYTYVGGGYSSAVLPQQPAAGWNHFAGSIADVGSYTRPLVQADVTALYNAGETTSNLLTSITRPSGKAYATITYNQATSRATHLTDENGGGWTINTPTVRGSSDVYRSAVMGNNPAGYYRLNDSAGSTLAVGQENYGDATYNGGVTLGTAGPFADQTAAQFDGSTGYVQLPNTDAVSSGPNSVEMWFKVPAGNTAGGVLFDEQSESLTGGDPTGGGYNPALYVGTDGRLHAEFWNSDAGPGGLVSPTLVNDGNWHYVVLSASTNSQTLYLDGNSVGTLNATLSMTGTGGYVYVGAGESSGWQFQPVNSLGYFTGSIAEVAFYRSQLQPADVADHYAAYKSGVGNLAPTEYATVVDPGSKTLTYEYDVLNGTREILYTDGDGSTTTYGYDSNGFQDTTTDADGDVTVQGHDVRGNVVSQTTCQNQAGNECSTAYYSYLPDDTSTTLTPSPTNDELSTSSDGRSASATDPTYETKYGYDTHGNQTTTTSPPVPGFPNGRTTTTVFSSTTNPVPAVGSATVDIPNGLPVETVSPGGAISAVAYFADGDVAASRDADGLVTEYTYDGIGRVLTKTTLPNTPVGYWSLAQPSGSGTAVADQSPAGNNLTSANVTWNGSAGAFNGTSSQITAPGPVLNTSTDFTISAWADLATANSNYQVVVSILGVNTNATQLYYAPNTKAWTFSTESADVPSPTYNVAAQSTAAATGVWTHLVGVYSATAKTVSLYVNGTHVATASAPAGFAGIKDLVIGSTNGGNYFDGSISNVQVYQRALSAGDVSRLYAAGNVGSAAGWWPLTQTSGTTVTDDSPAGNNLSTSDLTWNGTAGVFNGTGSQIGSAGPVLNTAQSYSVSAWVDLASTASGNNQAAVSELGSTASAFYLKYDAGSGDWLFAQSQTDAENPAGAGAYSSAAATVGAWTHLVGVYNASSGAMQLYVNGALAGSSTNSTVFKATGPLMIGMDQWDGSNVDYFDGQIADVQVYQRALSSGDVSSLYTAGHNDGSVVADTAPAGATTSYQYDQLGEVTQEIDPPVTDTLNAAATHTAVTTTTYDLDGDITEQEVSDATGGDAPRISTSTYNQYDQVATSTDANANAGDTNGATTTYTYDAYGNKVEDVDQDGNTTQYTYDADGNLLTQGISYTGNPVDPSSATFLTESSRAYDPAGRLASVTDSMGNVTSYTYTNNGLTATITRKDPTGEDAYVLQSNQYDAAGNLIKQTTNNGASVTNTSVDAADRTTSTTEDPAGVDRTTSVSYTPDDEAATVTQTDSSGYDRTTTAAYDPMGNPTSQTVYGDSTGHPTGWYPLTQTSGSTVTDASGTGNTANSTAVTWTGSSASFNGTSSQISTNGPVLNTAASYSVSAWVYENADTAAQTFVSQGGTESSAFLLQNDPTTKQWRFSSASADVASPSYAGVESTSGITLDTWTHLVGVYSSTSETLSLYVNGALVGSTPSTTAWSSSGALAIGRNLQSGAAAQFTNGQISDVQVYPQVLTAAQITTLYGNGRNGGTLGSSGQQTTSWTYDPRGLQTSMTDPDGNTTNYVYDQAGQLEQTVDPAVSVETGGGSPVTERPTSQTQYNTFGEPVLTADSNWNETSYVYDADGQKVSQTEPGYTAPGSSSPTTATTTWAYDALGNVTAVTQPDGQITRTLYDQLGDVAQVTDPDGDATDYTYDSNGDQLSTTDPTGAQTQATYDWMGRQVTSTQLERYPTAQTLTTTDSYAPTTGNPDGAFLSSEETPDGVTTSYGYDNLGEMTSQTDGVGNATRYAYDFTGQPYTTTYPDGSHTEVDYDAEENPVVQKTFDSSDNQLTQTSNVYDGDGNLLSSTDARGNTSTFTYDATGMVSQEVQPVSATSSITTSFGYDANGNRTQYTNGNGKSYYYTYTPWNQVQTSVEPETSTYNTAALSTTTYAYNGDGQLVSQVNPSGESVSLSYDGDGDVTGQSGAGATAATATRSFAYDGDGDVLTAGTSAAGTAGSAGYEPATSDSFTYNDSGNLLTAGGSAGSSSFGYNGDGLMTSQADAAGTTSYTYDGDDRLASLSDPATGTDLTYGYNDMSQLSSIQYGTGGDTRSYGYNTSHELDSDTLKSPTGSTFASIGYGYDANGNLTSKNTTGFDGSANNTYTYDEANRLTSWTAGTTRTPYSYDADGNRTQVGSNVYTYDARDELTSDGVNTYSYTADGDLSQDATMSGSVYYTTDAYGQQITAGSETYGLDASGRDITDAVSGGSTRTFQYDGASDTIASDGSNAYTYDPSGGLIGINQAGASSTATGVLAMTDQHDDVVGDFTSSGTALSGSTTYDPLGNVTATSDQVGSLGYESGWTDSSTGKVDMGARWYNPATGQFMNKDTTSLNPVPNSVSANPFAYVDDNPLAGTDPTGHCSSWDSWACTAVHDVTSGAKKLYHKAAKIVKKAGAAVSHFVSSVYDDAATSVMSLMADLKREISVRLQQISDAYHAVTTGFKRVYRYAAKAVTRKYRAAVHDVKTAYHTVAKAAKTATTYVKHHAAAITAFVVSTAVFMGCEGATLGVGTIGCAAVAGAVGSLVTQGFKCASGAAGACSADAFAESALTGAVTGALGGALGEVGGSLLGKLAPKALDAVGGLFGKGLSDAGEDALDGAGDDAADDATQQASDEEASESATSSVDGNSGDAPQSEAQQTGDPKAGDDSGSSCTKTNHSFTGSTQVLMADGSTESIDQVKVGDKIANSVPGQSGTQTNTVTGVIVTYTDHNFVDVTLTPVAKGAVSVDAGSSSAVATGKAKQSGAVKLLKRSVVGLAAALITVAAGAALTTHVASQPGVGLKLSAAAWSSSDAAPATDSLAQASAATASVTSAAAAVGGGTLTTTFTHPFYDITQAAFVDAQYLHVGDRLQTPTGTAAVTDLHLFHADTTTYDLTIGALHTYYVEAGTTPVLVHNCTLTIPERLSVLYQRLGDLPAPTTADEALNQLNSTLVSVEDEFSGVAANPNPGLKFDGRMYPPREDFIVKEEDGGLTATTKGNIIQISPKGSMKILSRSTGDVVYSRVGGG